MNQVTILPALDDVIIKVKQMQELTPEEEFVYYIGIEHISEKEALKILEISFQK